MPLRLRMRPRAREDRPALREVLARCAHDSGYFADDAGQLGPGAEVALDDSHFSYSWVGEIDDAGAARVVGHIGEMALPKSEDTDYLPHWLQATGAPAAEHMLVKRLFVDPFVQGRGVGRAMLEFATEHIREQQKIPLLDTPDTDLPAMRLYQKLGWREVGREKPSWRPHADFDEVLFVGPGF